MLKSCIFPIFCSKITCKEDDVSVSSDSLGEQLFELVNVYNTGHSQKITGKQPVLSDPVHPKYIWLSMQTG